MAWNSRRHGLVGVECLESRHLLASGTLDPTFSGDGKSTIAIGGGVLTVFDVAVQADGKAVVAGKFADTNGNQSTAVARFNFNGSLDTSFSGDGLTLFNFGDSGESHAEAVAIQADGKIVVVGSGAHFGGLAVEVEFGIARLLSNGSLDSTFDGDGKKTRDLGSFAVSADTFGFDVAIDSSGIIYAVGSAHRIPDRDFFITALKSNGDELSSFGPGGVKFIGFGDRDEAKALAIDLNGSVATNPRYGQITIGGQASSKAALVRLNPKALIGSGGAITFGGRFVNEFSGDGKLTYDAFTVNDLLIQPNGKTVVLDNKGVIRFNADGTIDSTFGTGGRAPARLTTVDGIVKGPSGGLIVSGSIGGQFAAVKYSDNGVVDTTWGVNGVFRPPSAVPLTGKAVIAAGPGRRVMLAGGTAFQTARIFDHGGGEVVAAFVDRNASEAGIDQGSIFVGRTERLPFPTRVFFSISGSATFKTLFGSDYQISGMTGPSVDKAGNPIQPFVDIPANQTFVTVTIAPIDDTLAEGPETAIFSIIPNANYVIGNPNSATINIADNDAGATTNLSGVNDAYVRDGTNANTNFGSATELQVKTSTTVGNTRLSYIKFDLSSIANIVSAKLTLFGRLSDTQNSTIAVSLFPVADNNWTGSGITFNNKPTAGATALASVNVVGTSLAQYQFDVTNYVKQEKALGRKLVSFLLKAPSASASFVSFVSGNAGSNQPKLSVLASADPVGTFTVNTPPASVNVGQDVSLAVKWEVPTGGWRQLTWVKLLLRDLDDPNSFVEFKFDEPKNAFYPVVRPGVLTAPASLVVSKSGFSAAGPTSPVVTTNFVFHFNASAAGRRFGVEVSARNDVGEVSPYAPAGSMGVNS